MKKQAMWLIGGLALFVVIFSLLKPAEQEATITPVGESGERVWEQTNAVKITTNLVVVETLAVTPTNNTNLVVVETLAVTPTNNVPEGYKRIKVSLVGDFAAKPQPQQTKTNQ